MSTQTQHLGLHQWEPDDDFLRTDFNQDFAKIDAGVRAAEDRVSMVKLMEVVTTEAATQVDLDVSGIQWEKYVEVIIYAAPRCGRTTIGSANIRVNNVSGSGAYYKSTGGSSNILHSCYLSGSEEGCQNVYHIQAMSGQLKVIYEFFSNTVHNVHYGYGVDNGIKRLADVKTINFIGNDTMVAGSEFYVYGIRK